MENSQPNTSLLQTSQQSTNPHTTLLETQKQMLPSLESLEYQSKLSQKAFHSESLLCADDLLLDSSQNADQQFNQPPSIQAQTSAENSKANASNQSEQEFYASNEDSEGVNERAYGECFGFKRESVTQERLFPKTQELCNKSKARSYQIAYRMPLPGQAYYRASANYTSNKVPDAATRKRLQKALTKRLSDKIYAQYENQKTGQSIKGSLNRFPQMIELDDVYEPIGAIRKQDVCITQNIDFDKDKLSSDTRSFGLDANLKQSEQQRKVDNEVQPVEIKLSLENLREKSELVLLTFFEGTPEAYVSFFSYLNRFGDLDNIQCETDNPLSVEEYCSTVWKRHLYALDVQKKYIVAEKKRWIEKFRRLDQIKKGLCVPEEENQPIKREKYSEMMRRYLYVPSKQTDFANYRAECTRLLAKHTIEVTKVTFTQLFEEYEQLNARYSRLYSWRIQIENKMSYYLKDTIRKLLKRAKSITGKTVSSQVSRVVRRKLSLQIENQHPHVCRLLEGMPVYIYVFSNLKVSFQIHFTELYHKHTNDLTEVARTINWLEEQILKLSQIAQWTEHPKIRIQHQVKLACILQIADGGQARFENAIVALQNLFKEPQEID